MSTMTYDELNAEVSFQGFQLDTKCEVKEALTVLFELNAPLKMYSDHKIKELAKKYIGAEATKVIRKIERMEFEEKRNEKKDQLKRKMASTSPTSSASSSSESSVIKRPRFSSPEEDMFCSKKTAPILYAPKPKKQIVQVSLVTESISSKKTPNEADIKKKENNERRLQELIQKSKKVGTVQKKTIVLKEVPTALSMLEQSRQKRIKDAQLAKNNGYLPVQTQQKKKQGGSRFASKKL